MDPAPAYSYGKSREMLDAMTGQAQMAFLVYCSARMLPFYDAFARRRKINDAGVLRRIVAKLWLLVLGEEILETDLTSMEATIANLALGEEEHCDERWEAIAAADSVAGALGWSNFLSYGHPVFAVESIRNVIYQRLNEVLCSPGNMPEGPGDDEVFAHPAMKSAMQDVMEVLEFLKGREELVEGDLKYLRMLAEKRLLPDRCP